MYKNNLEKNYQPKFIEMKLYNKWDSGGLFLPSGIGHSFSIMIPPPNITGNLHMGHAFQHTLIDTLVRWKRMQGYNTLWQFGTDHAGIATQILVEKNLFYDEKKSRNDIGRNEFIKKIWEWKIKYNENITRQIKRMGSSVDWSRQRFTLDKNFSKLVQKIFISLYDEGLIYRGKRLVNWDPFLLTAISDLEVINIEENSSLWYFRYPFFDKYITTKEGKNYIVVATTRPETILGDTCVAVNPKDKRYEYLIGKFIKLPLVDRKIPIIADTYVKPEFGTGCIKVTPAHDFNDYDIGKRNDSILINILTKEAKIRSKLEIYSYKNKIINKLNTNLPQRYIDLYIKDARKIIINDMNKMGLLEKIEDYTLKVSYGERSGVIIEPLLTDQWFINIESLSKPAIKAVEKGYIQFIPNNYENMYLSWMKNIKDWCISRQLWWGHRIPAWFDDKDNIYIARNENEVREKYKLKMNINLRQDNDVLDTWFSSGLWIFGAMDWPNLTEDLFNFYPTTTLITGFDIIFFWVARMIMMSLKFTKQVPFNIVYVHGVVIDNKGKKMSKSKGNVLDPIDLIDGITIDDLIKKRIINIKNSKKIKEIIKNTKIEFPYGIKKYGTDALRYNFLSIASTGRDIQFNIKTLDGYNNFCNKLWNAARYVLLNIKGKDCGKYNTSIKLTLLDIYIISIIQKLKIKITNALKEYRFDNAAKVLYEFIWNEYCDWYIEYSKFILEDKKNNIYKLGTRNILIYVLENILLLAHPMIPFITEEIWQCFIQLYSNTDNRNNFSIMNNKWPVAYINKINKYAIEDIEWLKNVIHTIRNIRSEINIYPNKLLVIYILGGNEKDQLRFIENMHLIYKFTKLSYVNFVKKIINISFFNRVGNMELHILINKMIINKQTEIEIIKKNIIKKKIIIKNIAYKLINQYFMNKAPILLLKKDILILKENKYIYIHFIKKFKIIENI
ncbi:Valyl-tRNA synthetase [Candidatus Johnevansia muelleri]|uniref:Valine--tRNA ligase n=1 Tax=Candidatus Johnevansia muelleri TaxID=1495769 RepID=A0A078KBH4_9GAMM|nr:Valyl-tRNA synthetase [Candidatus Evansia muelleri]